jgi:fructose-1,6-bisphosphatase/inositol monophosphatase family enzyme
MNKNADECIKILIELEPVFKKAGELALKMRKTAKSKNKFNTGIAGIDIVTEADTAVQEMILLEMAKTKLVECQLIAEEDTGSVKKFKGTNGLVLTLDPIDGTIFYASTGKFYSIIICLNDGKNPLYTFLHYPELNWTCRITKNGVEDFGDLPEINVKKGLDFSKTIVHTGKDTSKIDSEVYKKLLGQGYIFCKYWDITGEAGSASLFYLNKVAGYYTSNPNPYDGLCVLHYGQVKKFKIYSDIDISNIITGDHGPHCQGWYVVLRK